MILHQFPDLAWLKTQAEQRFSNRKTWGGGTLLNAGWPTVILNTQTQNIVRDEIRGPLSLFTTISGSASVSTSEKRVKVSPEFFFLSNADQRYTLEAAQEKTETFNIHFGEHFAESVLQAELQRYDQLIENRSVVGTDIAFYNKLFLREATVERAIQTIHQHQDDALLVEEQLASLINHLLQQHLQLSRIQGSIPALKVSTKEEIVKRLHYTTDYIYTFYHRDISLDELASVACLSKFHFLRLFKIAFSQTPHQFINTVRIHRAKTMLRDGRMEVKDIARALGFLNPGSFSRMFRQHTGAYPTQYF